MKKKLVLFALIVLAIFAISAYGFAENANTDTVQVDGERFTIKEVTNQEQIEYSSGDVDASNHWEYSGSYAPAFIVTVGGQQYFGFCIDVETQYTPSATYTATKIDGETGRLAASLLTYGFRGSQCVVDNSDEGIGWRDTWLSLRCILDVENSWSSQGSIDLTNYAQANLLPEGSYCYRFTYNDGQEAQAVVAVPVRGIEYGALKVVKTDAESGKELSDATFTVTGTSGTKVLSAGETWENILPGTYKITEITAPHGYLLNEEEFECTVNVNKTVTVTCADTAIKGRIAINKTAENKDDYEIIEGSLEYGKENLSNAVFTIYAKEDIVYCGEIKYNAGDLVGEMTTDTDGKATSDELYLGKYKVVETQSPEDYRILEEEFDVVLDENGQIPVVEYHIDCTNKLKKGDFLVLKIDSSDNTPLAGAEIAIYDEDMALITTVTSDENGKAILKNLSEGGYYYREVSAPDGFELDSTVYSFQISDGELSQCVLTNTKTPVTPDTPDTPNTPGTPGTTNTASGTTSPSTGINTGSTMLNIMVGIVVAIVIAAIIISVRKNRKIIE